MKKLMMILLITGSQNIFAWTVSGVHCKKLTSPSSTDYVTYTYINLEAGPDAAATLIQEIKLEDNPPNIGNGMTDYNQYGFFKSRKDQKEIGSPFDFIFRQPTLNQISLEDGTLFSQAGAVKQTRVEINVTKRYSDGEPNQAQLQIFTRSNQNLDWALSEEINDCWLSVYH